MLNHLTQASYEALIDETFQLALDDGRTIDMRLQRVYSLNATSPKYDSFSVEFQGPGDAFLPQQVCPLRHDQMGTINVFLVPVEEVSNGYIYQAVFNVAKNEGVDRF